MSNLSPDDDKDKRRPSIVSIASGIMDSLTGGKSEEWVEITSQAPFNSPTCSEALKGIRDQLAQGDCWQYEDGRHPNTFANFGYKLYWKGTEIKVSGPPDKSDNAPPPTAGLQHKNCLAKEVATSTSDDHLVRALKNLNLRLKRVFAQYDV